MPIANYGVWVGYPKSFVAETDDSTPHLQLFADEDPEADKGSFRAAINIKSSTKEESRLAYWFVRNFNNHPVIDDIDRLEPGWHSLTSDGPPALDFIRGNLIDLKAGSILRHNVPGEKNDIIDYISPVLNEAIRRNATVYLFGQSFPGGIHDVHMNQGNSGKFAKDNGIFQDGGILLQFPDDNHWEGIFLAFGVQISHTDDTDGSPIGDVSLVRLIEGGPTGGGGPVVAPDEPDVIPDGTVLIRAALVNPVGPDPTSPSQKETVYLRNRTQQDVDLRGWSIINNKGGRQNISGVLNGQGEKKFEVPNSPLSNQGGTISLLDSRGLKVDGVSYSKAQAKREGVLLYFH